MAAEGTLLPYTTLAYATSALAYAAFAASTRRRRVPEAARRANDAFALWWSGLAATSTLLALRNGLALAGVADLPLHLTLLELFVVANAVALAGLVAHVTYIFRGGSFPARWIAAGYACYFAIYTFLLFYTAPTGLHVGPVKAGFEYARPIPDAAVPLLVALFYGPQLVAALAYARLWREVREPEKRYRVVLTSASILVWSLTSMALGVATQLAIPSAELALILLSLASPMGALLATAPPAWVKRLVERRAHASRT